MDATPGQYREDIARTREAMANLERGPLSEQDALLHGALRRQLDALYAGLARAERLWARYQARRHRAAGSEVR